MSLFDDYQNSFKKQEPRIRRATHEDVHELEGEYSGYKKGWSKGKTLLHKGRVPIIYDFFDADRIAAKTALMNNDHNGYWKFMNRFFEKHPECRIKPTK